MDFSIPEKWFIISYKDILLQKHVSLRFYYGE